MLHCSPRCWFVADDRTNGNGGIQKWVQSAGTWALSYTLAPAVNVGCRGLTGYVDAGLVFLFATTSGTSANSVVSVIDMGTGSTFSTVASTGPNTFWRGIRFVRTPNGVVNSGVGCATSVGLPTIGTTGGRPLVGNGTFQIVGGNAPVFTIVLYSLKLGTALPFGIAIPGAPACALAYVLPDLLVSTGADAMGASSVPLAIPASASLAGAQLAAQNLPFDFSLAFGLPVGTSDAIDITIGN